MNLPPDLLTARLADHVRLRADVFRRHPDIVFPWWRPCPVTVLMVTDGGLDFGLGDFGLSAFVSLMLNDDRSYVRFDITLAHLRSDVTDAQVMKGAPRIVGSIKDFRFDDPAHFTDLKYDEVWLFGIETSFHRASYDHRNTHRAAYPAGRLSDAELRVLNAHMRRGGGVFATGDHGALGRALCGSVNRVRSMRYWDAHVVAGQDEVGMTNARRNDTNQPGDPGSQFSDQSDDVPQPIDLKLYVSRIRYFLRERYPHPLLCGPQGRIEVLPDHPHEGECIEPASLTGTFAPDGSEEYPPASGGGPRVAPEVIATSRVRAGNIATLRASSKVATVAHSFGAISAYDGRRAGVGRVVCDATWHHFVNVNLIGLVEGGSFDDLGPGNSPTKHDGFLATPGGRAALGAIKHYFVNIGVWIAPPDRHECFNTRLWWDVVYRDRIMEAALVDPDVALARIPLDVLHHVGTAARDVLGRVAGQCRSLEFVVDVLHPVLPDLVEMIDPWRPTIPRPDPPPFHHVDLLQVLETALGAAVVSLRQRYPYPVQEFDREVEAGAAKAIQEGLVQGAQAGLKQLSKELGDYGKVVKAGLKRLNTQLG